MGTDQLLDLFTLDASGNSPKKSSGAGQSSANATTSSFNKGARAIIEGMEELWDSQQYDAEYNLESFMSSIARGDGGS
jgi:TATA-binding protein-associated factor